MNEDDLIARVSVALRELYPEPVEPLAVRDQPTRHHGVNARVQVALAVAAVIGVVAIVFGFAARPSDRPPAASNPTSALPVQPSASTSSADALTQLQRPVIAADRLVRPFSTNAGRIQLSPLPDSYQSPVSKTRASTLCAGVRSTTLQPSESDLPVFLANLTDYSVSTGIDPSTNAYVPDIVDRPVWVCFGFHYQYGRGGPGSTPLKVLSDEVSAVDAESGRLFFGDYYSGPDSVTQTVAPTAVSAAKPS